MDGLPPEVRRLFEELRKSSARTRASDVPGEWHEREAQVLLASVRRLARWRRIRATVLSAVLIVVAAAAGFALGTALWRF